MALAASEHREKDLTRLSILGESMDRAGARIEDRDRDHRTGGLRFLDRMTRLQDSRQSWLTHKQRPAA